MSQASSCCGGGKFYSAPASSGGSIMPTGSANSWAYPFVDSNMPPYITATTGCPYQIFPSSGSAGYQDAGGFSAADLAGFY
ncbi:hypothetical protein GUITHDRAFT_150334 [Guillardia theta CCMP2712]|uniref:Uncharacterized protein n=1 Tax=Guillardia theta (strain CCMP2712) TaxID=905079 RepID=L1JX48_GUITC|nr:hypothetical protein GUITHDRAFT_150334 [Guillardia theta CCMP2712]EKX53161.1 hypothetical protein GUITHDRAFT_150334 [Guillardia theta CCMP2712]|mmetsp:Transcript_15201/g.51253  ORF Transcript_15201/g.51253 Transcript_15201/m.51253 type:complete len:81 (-) Transcript_15201:179-421(-)|eukprot:XP_005840141.1 hypothetical protein GUITHDRAFT_150334 [Guillardia theta CCMP2712]